MTVRVSGIIKIPGTDPPEFEVGLRDLHNNSPGYLGHTESGTEEALCEVLAKSGIEQQEVDRLFRRHQVI